MITAIVHPFGWGVEFIKENANGDDPRRVFQRILRKRCWQTATNFSICRKLKTLTFKTD
ncbi:MAG: hypothetical protein WKF71_06305 [Pyrinomonadaceae bacterium]